MSVSSKYHRFPGSPAPQAESPLFRQLHRKLSMLSLSVTGLTLVILTIVCLLISEAGIRQAEYTSFLTNVSTLCQNLEQQTTLSHEWIRQMEHNYHISIRIFDNGQPLFLQRLSGMDKDSRTDSDRLFGQIADIAAQKYHIYPTARECGSRLSHHAEFSIKEQTQPSSYAGAAVIPRKNGQLGILIWHPLTQIQSRIVRQRWFFLLADLIGLLLLFLFFQYFITRMLQPLMENREKQMQFIAAASHELRSPITVILSNLTACRSGLIPNDDSFLTLLDTEGNRMARLVNDMLQLANADSHSWSMHPAEVELDTLLLKVFESFESQAMAHQLRWDIRLPSEAIPPCLCDEERIRQLLAILIDNAFSYTPPGGSIRLTLDVSDTRFRLSVCDNGPGIPDAQKAQIFERFYRADTSRKSKSHFGLGLSIASEIAALHHGRLYAKDTPGGGATFTLELPYK